MNDAIIKPMFAKDSDQFYQKLRKEVLSRLDSYADSVYGNRLILKKVTILLGVFSIIYGSVYIGSHEIALYMMYALLGPLSVVILINCAHDASHMTAHQDPIINHYYLSLMSLLGPNAEIWKNRHNSGHHNFANILDHDPDLKQSALARIFPDADYYFYHRWQHIYVPLLYAFYTLNMVLVRDIKDCFVGEHKPKNIWTFIGYKAAYLMIFVGLPTLLTAYSLATILVAFLILHVVAGYFITIALVPSHVCDHVAFPLPDEEGRFAHTWAEHQVMTTVDFATESRFLTWILGGFNHHLTHHLFPNISHVYYPIITPIIKEKILNHGLIYQCENSLWNAYKSHYRLLRQNALPPLTKAA